MKEAAVAQGVASLSPFQMTGSFHPRPFSDHLIPECDSHGQLDEQDVSPFLTNDAGKERDGRGWQYIFSAPKRSRGKDVFHQRYTLHDIESSSHTPSRGEYTKQSPLLVSQAIVFLL